MIIKSEFQFSRSRHLASPQTKVMEKKRKEVNAVIHRMKKWMIKVEMNPIIRIMKVLIKIKSRQDWTLENSLFVCFVFSSLLFLNAFPFSPYEHISSKVKGKKTIECIQCLFVCISVSFFLCLVCYRLSLWSIWLDLFSTICFTWEENNDTRIVVTKFTLKKKAKPIWSTIVVFFPFVYRSWLIHWIFFKICSMEVRKIRAIGRIVEKFTPSIGILMEVD